LSEEYIKSLPISFKKTIIQKPVFVNLFLYEQKVDKDVTDIMKTLKEKQYA